MIYRIFAAKMADKKTLKISVYVKPDGRFDQYLVERMRQPESDCNRSCLASQTLGSVRI